MNEELPNVNETETNSKAVSIKVLRKETRDVISALLNPVKLLKTKEKLPRYWWGLAELCGVGGEEIPSVQASRDQCSTILDLWIKKNPRESTIENLEKYLERLDRFDVIDDIQALVAKDIEYHNQFPDGYQGSVPAVEETDVLIAGDVERREKGLPPLIYDAFVLFSDDDVDFAVQIRDTMRQKPYNLEICTREDLPGGCIELDAIIQCITNRCKRVVLVLSSNFFQSSANHFYCRFGQMVGIEQKNRKIIPCLRFPYSRDKLPPDLRMYVPLVYDKSNKFCNFWDKLYNSIIVSSQSPVPYQTRVTIKKSMETLKEPELKPINHVKFNSMGNLNVETETTNTVLPAKEVSPSSSYNSLEPYVGSLKKKNSIYKTLKGLIHPRNARHSDGNIEKTLKVEDKEKVDGKDKQDEKPDANGVTEKEKTVKEESPKENGAVKREKSIKKEKPLKLRNSFVKMKLWKNHKVKVPVAN